MCPGYTTFCNKLDSLFGGYREGKLLHIYGEAKTGKTTLAWYIPTISIFKCLSESKKLPKHGRFILISTDGGFEVSRWQQLCEVHNVPFDELWKRSLVIETMDFSTQYKTVVYDLPSHIQSENIKPLLVTLDPATISYREMWKDVKQKDVLLVARELVPKLEAQLIMLLRFARQYNCVSIVTNIKRRFKGFKTENRSKYDFYGGHSFAYLPYCCLRLEREDVYSNIVTVTNVFHRSSKPSEQIKVLLTEKGFREVK